MWYLERINSESSLTNSLRLSYGMNSILSILHALVNSSTSSEEIKLIEIAGWIFFVSRFGRLIVISLKYI